MLPTKEYPDCCQYSAHSLLLGALSAANTCVAARCPVSSAACMQGFTAGWVASPVDAAQAKNMIIHTSAGCTNQLQVPAKLSTVQTSPGPAHHAMWMIR